MTFIIYGQTLPAKQFVTKTGLFILFCSKREITADQPLDKQRAENHLNGHINIHAVKMRDARPPGQIQTATFPT